jgi:hypothetical protein
MKKQNNKVFAVACSIIAVAVVLITFAGSCSKSNPNATFIGTYYGTQTISGLGTSPDTLVMTAGSSSSAVIILSRGGTGGSATINGTVAGTTLTVPTQTITVNGGSAVVSGTGALNGSAFTANWTEVQGGITLNVTYTGNKQ